MTQLYASDPVNEAKLPRRDYIILPILCLLTFLVMFLASELVSKRYFEADSGIDSCDIRDPTIGFRHRLNCISRRKAVDGPWVTNHYNDCGYRTKLSCGPKPSETTRIALLGSSMSLGLYVGDDQTFAAQTGSILTRFFKRPVQVQNLGREDCPAVCALHRVDEALALRPDLLIIAVSPPFDLETQQEAQNENSLVPQASAVLRSIRSAKSFLFKNSSTTVALVDFMNLHNAAFAQFRILHYLLNEDVSGYLEAPFSPAWEIRMEALDNSLAEAASKSNAAKVPVVLIEIPSLQQAALSKMTDLPARVDPHAFNDRLKQIARLHGMQFIDGLEAFSSEPDIYKLYYLSNSHLNEEGHALIGRVVVKKLIEKQSAALLGHNEAQAKTASKQEG